MWGMIAMVGVSLAKWGYDYYQTGKAEDRIAADKAEKKIEARKSARFSLWQMIKGSAKDMTILRRDRELIKERFETEKEIGNNGKWKKAQKASREAHEAFVRSGGARRTRPLGDSRTV